MGLGLITPSYRWGNGGSEELSQELRSSGTCTVTYSLVAAQTLPQVPAIPTALQAPSLQSSKEAFPKVCHYTGLKG